MEQFRQIGEVLGSLRSLMFFRDNILINQRQCCLLLDVFGSAYDMIAEEMKQNLRFEEKNVKWRIIEQPLGRFTRFFKEGEDYIRMCLDIKDLWAKAITLYRNTDAVLFHIHNLLALIPVVIESIEIAGEVSGKDHEEMQKKRLVYSYKYQKEWKDPDLFQWKFGRQYLMTQDFCNRFDTVWKEDRWILLNKIQEQKISGSTKLERRIMDLLLKQLDGLDSMNQKILPASILIGSKDFQVRRRLGAGSQLKEIQWLGESLALRHFYDDIEPLLPEISSLFCLSHPHILPYICGFTDEEKKECFLVMELMPKDLSTHIKENCGSRKTIPFTLPVAVDLMLQIARGMEYLHSKKIRHGNLNPSSILVKLRSISAEGFMHAKVSGFGLSTVKNMSPRGSPNQSVTLPLIWYAPEVLEEQEQAGIAVNSRFTEKSDVYSFGMVCFELLTGKVPFEDLHLQGDKMSRNIRAGERPLFPLYSPKYVTNLTKKCWHTDPNQRPSFSSICRILRYIKRFLLMNPDYSRELDPPMPEADYLEVESKLSSKFPSWNAVDAPPVGQIPFQMFVYRFVEKERSRATLKETSESGSDKASYSGDENVTPTDESVPSPTPSERKYSISANSLTRKPSTPKRSPHLKASSLPGTPRGRLVRPPPLTVCRQTMRIGSESQLMTMYNPRCHASDSELPYSNFTRLFNQTILNSKEITRHEKSMFTARNTERTAGETSTTKCLQTNYVNVQSENEESIFWSCIRFRASLGPSSIII